MSGKNLMNILYAPWRQKYNTNKDIKENSKDPKTCVFCNYKKDKDLVILDGKRIFIQANKFPYGSGHLLVIPKRHVNTITDLTSLERKELFNLIDLAVYALDKLMKPEGYNIGCSVGRIAGESIQHLHFHVLPRFEGDIGWNRLCDFSVVSTTPKEITKKVKNIITKHKLKKMFGV